MSRVCDSLNQVAFFLSPDEPSMGRGYSGHLSSETCIVYGGSYLTSQTKQAEDSHIPEWTALDCAKIIGVEGDHGGYAWRHGIHSGWCLASVCDLVFSLTVRQISHLFDQHVPTLAQNSARLKLGASHCLNRYET